MDQLIVNEISFLASVLFLFYFSFYSHFWSTLLLSSLGIFGFFMFNRHVKHKLNAKVRSTVPNDVCNSFFNLIFSLCFTYTSVLTFIGANCSQLALACFNIAVDTGLKKITATQRFLAFRLKLNPHPQQCDIESINYFGYLHLLTLKS